MEVPQCHRPGVREQFVSVEYGRLLGVVEISSDASKELVFGRDCTHGQWLSSGSSRTTRA